MSIELDKEEVVRLYELGNTTKQIGEIFDITAPTISKILRNQGIKIRGLQSILTDEQKEQISSMRDSGNTLKQIAEVFNVSIGVIRNSLVKREEKNVVQFNTFMGSENMGYKPIQFEKKRTQINNELNLYIPEKWK